MKEKEYMHWMEGIRPDYIAEATGWNNSDRRHTILMHRVTAAVTASAAAVAVCAGAFIYNGSRPSSPDTDPVQPVAEGINFAGTEGALRFIVPGNPNNNYSYSAYLYDPRCLLSHDATGWNVGASHLRPDGGVSVLPETSVLYQYTQSGWLMTDGRDLFWHDTETTIYKVEPNGDLTEFYTPEDPVTIVGIRYIGDGWYLFRYDSEISGDGCYWHQPDGRTVPANPFPTFLQPEGEDAGFWQGGPDREVFPSAPERDASAEYGYSYHIPDDISKFEILCKDDSSLKFVSNFEDEDGQTPVRCYTLGNNGETSYTELCENGTLLETAVTENGTYLLIQTNGNGITLLFVQDGDPMNGSAMVAEPLFEKSEAEPFVCDKTEGWLLAADTCNGADSVLLGFPQADFDGVEYVEARFNGYNGTESANDFDIYYYSERFGTQEPDNPQPVDTQVVGNNFLGGIGELIPFPYSEELMFYDNTRIWNLTTTGWYADKTTGKLYNIDKEILAKYCTGDCIILSDGRDIFLAQNNECYRIDSTGDTLTPFMTVDEDKRFTCVQYLAENIYCVSIAYRDENGDLLDEKLIYNEKTGETRNYAERFGITGVQVWRSFPDGTFAVAFSNDETFVKIVRFDADFNETVVYEGDNIAYNWYLDGDTLWKLDFKMIGDAFCQYYACIDTKTGEEEDYFTTPADYAGVMRMLESGNTYFIDPGKSQLTLWQGGTFRTCTLPDVGERAQNYLISTGYHLAESADTLYITIPDTDAAGNHTTMLAEIPFDNFENGPVKLYHYSNEPAPASTTAATSGGTANMTTATQTVSGQNLFGGTGDIRPLGQAGIAFEDDAYWYIPKENIRVSKNADTTGHCEAGTFCQKPGCMHDIGDPDCLWEWYLFGDGSATPEGLKTDGRDLYVLRGRVLNSIDSNGKQTPLCTFHDLPGGYTLDNVCLSDIMLSRVSNTKLLIHLCCTTADSNDGLGESTIIGTYIYDFPSGNLMLINPNDSPEQMQNFHFLSCNTYITDGNGGLWFISQGDDSTFVQVDPETGIWTMLAKPEHQPSIYTICRDNKIYYSDSDWNICCYDLSTQKSKILVPNTETNLRQYVDLYDGRLARVAEEYTNPASTDQATKIYDLETGKLIADIGTEYYFMDSDENFTLLVNGNYNKMKFIVGGYTFFSEMSADN